MHRVRKTEGGAHPSSNPCTQVAADTGTPRYEPVPPLAGAPGGTVAPETAAQVVQGEPTTMQGQVEAVHAQQDTGIPGA